MVAGGGSGRYRDRCAVPLRNPVHRPAAPVGGVSDGGYLRAVEGVDNAVLAGGAHVVTSPRGSAGRFTPTGRSGRQCPAHSRVTLVVDAPMYVKPVRVIH